MSMISVFIIPVLIIIGLLVWLVVYLCKKHNKKQFDKDKYPIKPDLLIDKQEVKVMKSKELKNTLVVNKQLTASQLKQLDDTLINMLNCIKLKAELENYYQPNDKNDVSQMNIQDLRNKTQEDYHFLVKRAKLLKNNAYKDDVLSKIYDLTQVLVK